VGLCALSAFVWLAFVLELVSPVRLVLADRGVPLGLGLLFFVIPIGLVLLARLRRGERARGVARAARAGVVLFLVLSWVPAASFAAWVAALVPLWPFTLREGPDTASAREGFRVVFGEEPPAAVHDLYYRVDGPRDPTFFLRAEGVERHLVERAVARLLLEESPATVPTASAGERVPSWWPTVAPIAAEAFARDSEGLWYDGRTALVLYRRVTF
jgi:hypothetical protein